MIIDVSVPAEVDGFWQSDTVTSKQEAGSTYYFEFQ